MNDVAVELKLPAKKKIDEKLYTCTSVSSLSQPPPYLPIKLNVSLLKDKE